MNNSYKRFHRPLRPRRKKIPGAVNSPVRAWKAVGQTPAFIARGEGADGIATAHCSSAMRWISCFRRRYGAGYELFGADPDLVMLGKIIGSGLPVGAVAGRAALM